MKNIIAITALIAAGTAFANAEDFTKIADMATLVSGATNNGVVTSSDWTYSGGSVYDFSASNAYFSAGTNDTVTSALTASSGYVTIAAWVNLSSTTANQYQTIFGFGEVGKGFKFSAKGSNLAFVTKNNTEKVSSATVFSADTWTLVGVSFNAGSGTKARVFWSTAENAFNTFEGLTAWNAPTINKYAIGSMLQGSYSEGFNGLMTGLSVFTSSDYLSGKDIATAMGSAPVAPIPEPSAFGLLAGVGALALVAARRRRRAK